jgi:adenylate kinase
MSSQQPQIIILMGRSGCGKGTQAKLLQKEFGFDCLGSGDLLRTIAKRNDFSGQKLRKILGKGERVQAAFMFSVWSEEVRNMKNKPDLKGLILDGNPRALLEAKLMDDIFNWVEWTKIKVILLTISDQEAFNRLTKRRICKKCGRLIPWVGQFKDLKKCDKCGGQLISRPDDKPAVIRARLDFYNKDVQPAVDYYHKQGKLVKVNGQQSIEDVYRAVKKIVE